MPPIPPLPDATLLLVEVGSTAHGTGLPGGEDHDEMGIVIESPAEVLGLQEGMRSVMQRTQPDGVRSGPGDTDRTLHPLRRFLRLAITGNPSILMALWAPVLSATEDGHDLQRLGRSFIGRHVIPRYRGYMETQALRLLGLRGRSGHGRRGSGGREELIDQFGFDTKYAMHCARLGFQCLELLSTRRLSLPMKGETAEWLIKLRQGQVGFDEWWRRSLELDSRLEQLEHDQSLRPGPEVGVIESWSIETHLRHWRSPDTAAAISDICHG